MSNLMTGLVKTRHVDKTKVVSGGAVLVAYSTGPTRIGAPALVFLHAGVSDSRLWAHQFDTFGTRHRVVAFDRRGFGATAAVDEHFSSVDDLIAVLDALTIPRAVLIGCSQGGRIALDATLAHPERVAGLVLVAAAIGGAPESATHDPRLDALIAAYEEAEQADDLDARNRIEAHVWLDGPFSVEGRVSGPARELFLAMNRIVLGGPQLGTADVPDTAWRRLGDIAVPTMVMWGPLDVPSVVANLRHAVATIPRATACEFEGVAHLPSLETPDRFDAGLATFLHDVAIV